jgi:hypothetical protein
MNFYLGLTFLYLQSFTIFDAKLNAVSTASTFKVITAVLTVEGKGKKESHPRNRPWMPISL